MTRKIFLGIDIGSAEHACEAIDESRQTLWLERVANTHEGCNSVLERVRHWQHEGYEIWVMAEGINGYASPYDRRLIEAGCRYVNIQPVQLQRDRELSNWQPDKTGAKDARLPAEMGQWLVERNQQNEVPSLDEYYAFSGRGEYTTIEMVGYDTMSLGGHTNKDHRFNGGQEGVYKKSIYDEAAKSIYESLMPQYVVLIMSRYIKHITQARCLRYFLPDCQSMRLD